LSGRLEGSEDTGDDDDGTGGGSHGGDDSSSSGDDRGSSGRGRVGDIGGNGGTEERVGAAGSAVRNTSNIARRGGTGVVDGSLCR